MKPNGGYCVCYPSNIFYARPHFGEPFLKAFKRQVNSVRAQNIVSLFKMFSSIHFNNLSGMKTKRANVNRKVRKMGNQNSISVFQVFTFIHFNNLLGIKAKRANVNLKVRKLGNITWGISDIPQFWLHHVTCLDQSRAGKIFDGL